MLTRLRMTAFQGSAAAIFICFFPELSGGQSIQFPRGTAPVIDGATVKSLDDLGRPTAVANPRNGLQYAARYDNNGRLVSLKSTRGPNAYDLRAVDYSADGHLARVEFGNWYEIKFQYFADGEEEVVDSLGGRLTRRSTSGATGSFKLQSATDPSGYLVKSLQLIDQLFLLFGRTPGLSTTAVP